MKETDEENNTIKNNTDETHEMKRRIKTMNNNINKNKNNKLSHLSFEEYFESDWRKHFQEQDTIQSILDAAGLSNSHDFVQLNSRYLIDDNRMAVIALVRRKNAKALEKLIIDVIAGNSSFEQFFDVVYNIGSDCDYRMIICDWNSKNRHPGLWMTDNIMYQLIDLFEHHLCLYWISADALRDVDGTMKVIYTVMESAIKTHCSLDMPDRRDIEHAELYCYTLEASGYMTSCDEYRLHFDSYYEDESALTVWKDEGIVTEINMDQDDYTWLFTRRTDEIKHDNCSYEYNNETGTLTITEDVPFQNFRNSLPKAKSDLADDYYGRARIGSWIDELLREKEEEQGEHSGEADGSSNMPSFMETFHSESKECSNETEPIKLPSVLEFLDPDWKEHFLKPETIEKIIQVVIYQNELRDYHFAKRSSRGREGIADDTMVYDFIEIISISDLNDSRQRIVASFLDIESGLFENWSFDITSAAPQWDQLFDALYNTDHDCAKKLILYFEGLENQNESDPEIEVEKETLERTLYDITSFTDSIYSIQVKTTDSYDEENNIDVWLFNNPPSAGIGRRRKIPSRSIFENGIWKSYYDIFEYSSAIRGRNQNVVTSFRVMPEWTEKGLSMRIYAYNDCPETNWLLTDKKDELARYYSGCEMKVVMEPGIHYRIDIQLHSAPVHDFIESSPLALSLIHI